MGWINKGEGMQPDFSFLEFGRENNSHTKVVALPAKMFTLN